MPHFVIEYFTENPAAFDRQAVLQTALACGAESGIMQREDIKVRLLPAEAILFGDGRRSFIHVTISLLAGRKDAAKLALATELTGRLRALCPQIEAISADVRDMTPAANKKSRA